MLLQLMYKALFELADDRADFVSMLFSKPRPKGLGANLDGGPVVRGVRRLAGERGAVPAESPRGRATPDENAPPAAHRRRYRRHRVRLRRVLPERLRGPAVADLRRAHDGRRWDRRQPELSGQRGELRGHEAARVEKPGDSRRRRLRRAEGHPRHRALPEGARRHGERLLPLERRAIPLSGPEVERPSAATWRRSRSTPPAPSSAPPRAAASRGALASSRASARWRRK